MADLPPYRETGSESESGSSSGPRNWAKILGLATALLLVVLFVGLHLTGVVGPGR